MSFLHGGLLGLATLQTLVIMISWHFITRAQWRRFPAGRVLMGLLAVMGAILTLSMASAVYPAWPWFGWLFIAGYTLLNIALSFLGYTIIREQRRHVKRYEDREEKPGNS